MEHLTEHNIISPTQYAFRPNSSTTLALQTIIDEIHKHKSKKRPTLAIYIDLSKAYDTISHEKLLHKLQHDFNFTAETVTFFKSYFRNRVQTTHTQHAQSEERIITDGIPQGSTLSTTFFLLYINDIIRTVPNSSVYTYADDTTLVVTSSDIPTLQALAQTELNNLINYFHSNHMAELKILDIQNLYTHRVCMQLHSFVHPSKQLNRPQHNNRPLWTAELHEYPTRYSLQGHQYVPKPSAYRLSKKKATHTTSHFATKHWTVWNSIPERIRTERRRNVFKRALKEHLLRRQSE